MYHVSFSVSVEMILFYLCIRLLGATGCILIFSEWHDIVLRQNTTNVAAAFPCSPLHLQPTEPPIMLPFTSSSSPCKCSSTFPSFNSHFPSLSSPKLTFHHESPPHAVKPNHNPSPEPTDPNIWDRIISVLSSSSFADDGSVSKKAPSSEDSVAEEKMEKGFQGRRMGQTGHGFFSSSWYAGAGSVAKTAHEGSVVEKMGKGFQARRMSQDGIGFSSSRPAGAGSDTKTVPEGSGAEKMGKGFQGRRNGQNGHGLSSRRLNVGGDGSADVGRGRMKSGKGSEESVAHLAKASPLRMGLNRCSKMGDFMGALELYDSAVRDGIKLEQYQYTVLLYLCSSAAMGVIRRAKSGSGNRESAMLISRTSVPSSESDVDDDQDEEEEEKEVLVDDVGDDLKYRSSEIESDEIIVSEEGKKYVLEKGLEIYKKMCAENVPFNEATLTSVARMAVAMGDGDMAFDMVKKMKELGINPRLRSYAPALSAYCSNGRVEEAFVVEKHMVDNGIVPEEPELEVLLRLSIEAGKADKVYYVLHKLRVIARSISASTAELVEKWFRSKKASRVGKRKWDQKTIARVVESVGGGWHGQGWLGSGKWTVSRSSIGADGLCKCCGEKLGIIDLDPEETERFAELVESMARRRDKHGSFEKFQKWLDNHGPFEAVIDAANIGLFKQSIFKPYRARFFLLEFTSDYFLCLLQQMVKAVVDGIRTMLQSKWPLIILHNRHIYNHSLSKSANKALIEKWRAADAMYTTPAGSNDDWYWLYAAIRFKCLLVTNDLMRDHVFQLLGNDFFPKWKERHQVKFSFDKNKVVFHMPPPYSVVIQESDRGHWHFPVVPENASEMEQTWLCITRARVTVQGSNALLQDEGNAAKANSNNFLGGMVKSELLMHVDLIRIWFELRELRSQIHHAADHWKTSLENWLKHKQFRHALNWQCHCSVFPCVAFVLKGNYLERALMTDMGAEEFNLYTTI
ncbi:Proteinaceous RNase P 1, chloroplastic/mitochondrial-like protein [Drosera capensis]